MLYGLYALLETHLGKEEEICLPALDRVLTPDRIRALTNAMELFEVAEQAAE